MKIVAVDYDNTISDNEIGWLSVMAALEAIGYQVIVVTYRDKNCYPSDLDFVASKGYKVYFTSQVAKKDYMQSLGVHVDIWIDDTPESIVCDYSVLTGFTSRIDG